MYFFFRFLLLVFVVLISKSSFSDNIFDISLEKYHLGDSLLKYYKKSEIEKAIKDEYPKSKKFIRTYFILKNSKYKRIAFHYKTTDKNYTIYNMSMSKNFGKDNLDICLSYKTKIVNEYKNKLSIEPTNYNSNYKIDDGKSIAYISDFQLEGGNLRMYCVDWSDFTEKNRDFKDVFEISVTSEVLVNWLNNEAY